MTILIILLTFSIINFGLTTKLQDKQSITLMENGITILDDQNLTQKTGIQVSQSNYQNGVLVDNKIGELYGQQDYYILFYKSQCKHSKQFIQNIYKHIKPKFDTLDFKVQPFAIECVSNIDTCANFYIQDYPTLYYFRHDGQMFIYPLKLNKTIDSVLLFARYSNAGSQIDMSLKYKNMSSFIQALQIKLFGKNFPKYDNKIEIQTQQNMQNMLTKQSQNIDDSNVQEENAQRTKKQQKKSKSFMRKKKKSQYLIYQEEQPHQSLEMLLLQLIGVIAISYFIIDRSLIKLQPDGYKKHPNRKPQLTHLSPSNQQNITPSDNIFSGQTNKQSNNEGPTTKIKNILKKIFIKQPSNYSRINLQ